MYPGLDSLAYILKLSSLIYSKGNIAILNSLGIYVCGCKLPQLFTTICILLSKQLDKSHVYQIFGSILLSMLFHFGEMELLRIERKKQFQTFV